VTESVRLPATVIVQTDRGAINVLAAFASAEMSLRRHLDTIVKRWPTANCSFIFRDSRLLLGAVEEMDSQVEFDFTDTLREVLGGS
jgi:hypothetical protein